LDLPSLSTISILRSETNDNVVAYLANEAKFFGIIKRKHKADNPSPLVFVPNLLTKPSIP